MSYTLVIAEKPAASEKIATALAEGKLKKIRKGKTYWFEFVRNGKKHVCVPAVGHLFVLDTKNTKGWNYPVFSYEWTPTYTRKGSEFTRIYFKNIKDLVANADEFISATDLDTEGCVISYNILRFICGVNDGKRMKFSTLVKSDLIDAYENMSPHLEFGMIESGLTRHELDWLYGINTSRALTLSMREFLNRGFIVVSSGRVQSPTLKLLVDRELEIRKFVPVPFWQLELYCLFDGQELIALYEKDKIWKKGEAQKIFDACKGKDATVEDVQKRKQKRMPPFPFDTTGLQTEAYRCFRFSPKQTMSIAEALYNQALISYPRTSSQKLPAKIGYKKILEGLSKISTFKKLSEELLSKKSLKPLEGKKTDPAHISIYPTGEIPKGLTSQQHKLYELIVRRFLSVFGDPAIREIMKVILDVNGHKFILTGKRTIDPGWTRFYGWFAKLEEQILPELKRGQVLKYKDLKLLEKETQPPNHYTQGSIIKEMEKRGLGTKSTRQNILQTLYDRGYIKGKSIEVTGFGEKVIEVLEQYCPRIISEELTRKFENEMESVMEGKKRRSIVVEEAKGVLTDILDDFKKNEEKIGERLSKAYISFKRGQKTVGKCPSCGGELRIIRSKKTGKRFIGCSGYPKCNTSFPLMQFGQIKVLPEKCKECGLPMIMVKRGKKRPYKMCINHECKSKDGWKKN